jgi:hypothetical protein
MTFDEVLAQVLDVLQRQGRVSYRALKRRFARQGDLPTRALPLLARAVGICHEIDLSFFLPRMAAALGAAYTLCGRVADAVPLLTRAMEQATAREMVPY